MWLGVELRVTSESVKILVGGSGMNQIINIHTVEHYVVVTQTNLQPATVQTGLIALHHTTIATRILLC